MSKPPRLPPPLDLLWGDGDRRQRQRAGPQLSVERIVGAAVALADAEGLAAVSMARVAERLGAATMALYRHVRSKDELVALMLDAAVGDPPEAVDVGGGWRAGLERWAEDLLDLLRRHRWALDLPLARIAMGPRRAAWLDGGLSALADTGLLEQEKTALVLLVNDYVFSHVRLDAQLADADTSAASSAFLPPTLDASRYAALQKALDAGAFGESARDRNADFAFGLARILDGIDRLVTERGAERSTECT
jgi:AcrR family transcriptional regulator